MTGGGLGQPLFKDLDVDGEADAIHRTVGVGRRGSANSEQIGGSKAPEMLDVEDALDRLGGLGRFQAVHILSCGIFWFANPAVLFSVFANGMCLGGGDTCTGNSDCCSAYEEGGGCAIDDDVGSCVAAGDDGGQPWWSSCRSVSCQFDLPGETNTIRSLFDSAFFAGWLWAAPLIGRVSDVYGRRTALWISLGVLHSGQLLSALSPNWQTYLVARHLTGFGIGAESLTAFVLAVEYAPRSRATIVKTYFHFFSMFGYVAQAFFAKALFNYLPGYNFRLLTLIMSSPLLLWTFVAYFLINESPRYLLVAKGVPAATSALLKVGRVNGTMSAFSTFKLRPPTSGGERAIKRSEVRLL